MPDKVWYLSHHHVACVGQSATPILFEIDRLELQHQSPKLVRRLVTAQLQQQREPEAATVGRWRRLAEFAMFKKRR